LKSKTVKYYSTNRKSPEVSFKEALLKGLAPDGGLYLPSSFPLLTNKELESLSEMKYSELAFFIINKLIEEEIDGKDLLNICHDAYNFEVPLERVCDRKYIMRLDQGPSASFKDFAARMMSRLMQHYLTLTRQHLTILTATSGDTGSAVANAFYALKNINVIILFPGKEVTPIQRKQMTTLDDNIRVISINGKFDDCQKLVKKAFLDPALSGIYLSSANSINIGRLLPQSVYYYYAWSKLSTGVDDKIVFSVPSGNFGNLMGGIVAREMGLPVYQFVISTNENDEVPSFLKSGNYKSITPSKNCISSAMNVGHPSNLARIVALYGGRMSETGEILISPDMQKMRNDFFAVSVTDDATKATIEDIYKKFNIILEPHGAIAWNGINEYFRVNENINSEKQLCVSLETAHPAKFPDELRKIIDVDPLLPSSLSGLEEKAENVFSFDNKYETLREFILKYY